MKKLAILAALAMLGACSKPAPVTPAAEETTPAPATEASAAAATLDNGVPAGNFSVVDGKGMAFSTAINADGTYADTAADGKVLEEGTWAVSEGETCFTPKNAAVECFTPTAPGADGSFTSTSDKGRSLTVKPAPTAG